MQNSTEPQAGVEVTNPKSEAEQIDDIGDVQARFANVQEVDSIAKREMERIQQYQLAKYGELVHREDEPLYGLEPIEGGGGEVPKEEPTRRPNELNLTWAIVFGGLLVFGIFAIVIIWSTLVHDPDHGIINQPLSPPPYQLDGTYQNQR